MTMEFYKRIQPGRTIGRTLKKLLQNKRLVAVLAVVLFMCGYVTFGSHGILQRVRLQRQAAELARKLHDVQEETKALREQSKALETDRKAIEKVARERYGMARPGETVYKVKKDAK